MMHILDKRPEKCRVILILSQSIQGKMYQRQNLDLEILNVDLTDIVIHK